jgi:hypothetical protein
MKESMLSSSSLTKYGDSKSSFIAALKDMCSSSSRRDEADECKPIQVLFMSI